MQGKFNISVLVAPLDWGLGHATRCIPIIKALEQLGCTVIIAAEGATAALLCTEFPSLTILPIKGYRIRYAQSKWALPFTILFQIPQILRAIRNEQRWLKQTIQQHGIQLVISDNRYGLYSKQVPSVFITHQLTIKMPFAWLEKRVQRINYNYINRFAACWVPDVPDEKNVAGQLSHPAQLPAIPVHYLGILSRFNTTAPQPIVYDYCVLISGPEPQRSLFEQIVLAQLDRVSGKKIIVRGKPGTVDDVQDAAGVTIHQHLSGEQLQQVMQQSRFIICRSGYTTVMEILALHKKSILVPTPGQTEQEYLAERLMQQQWAYSVQQGQLNVADAIATAEQFEFVLPGLSNSNMDTIITNLLKQIS